jgi:hypothetical protein
MDKFKLGNSHSHVTKKQEKWYKSQNVLTVNFKNG